MPNRSTASRSVLAFCLLVSLGAPALAATIVVPGGSTDTNGKTVSGTDTVTVETNGTLQTTGTAISWNNTSTDLIITNSGTIRSTATGGRAINASGGNNARTVTLTNNAGALIESYDDAFRINVNPSGGTITINNYGTIRTVNDGVNGGQALDFNAASSGNATILINNFAGGSLLSQGHDAVRPGQSAIITNAGTIRSDGAANNSFDGIDWQTSSGVVINQSGGIISGLRHGITSDVDVNVTNQAGGQIIGRNGSGVGSDGNGTVVNRGLITGSWDGVANNGDGDGVDIDFIGDITNSGTIRGISAAGVDSGFRPNNAEGIAMGGGIVRNEAGGLISGRDAGILVDDGAEGSGYGATTIINAGTIEGVTGPAIKLVGNFDDVITNSGTISGNGIAIDMGAGNDTLNLLPGSNIVGTVDGGAGTDSIVLGGTGSGVFGGAVNFESFTVASGNWAINGTVAGVTTTVGNGARLGGNATLAGVTIQSGGTIAPGNSIGTITVKGAFVQSTGSTYAAEINGAGQSDRIVATGAATIQSGTTLAVQPVAGDSYTPGTRYTVLTADGGVTGNYETLTNSLGTIELRLGSTANSIYVDVARTGLGLSSVARSRNQIGVAAGLGGLTVANGAFAAATVLTSDDATRGALDLLSGEVHGSARTALVRDVATAHQAVLGRLDEPVMGSGVWAQFVLGGGEEDGRSGAADSRRAVRGGFGGIDLALGEAFRVGVAGGYTHDRLDIAARASSARLKTVHALAYLGGTLSGFSLRAGVGYSWSNVDSDRSVSIGGFTDRLIGEYDANSVHGFLQAGLPIAIGDGTIEPFGGLTATRVHSDTFTERGGAAALRGAARNDTYWVSTLGLKARTPISGNVWARAKAAWEYALDDLDARTGRANLSFVAGGSGFTAYGMPLSRNAATMSAAVGWNLAPAAGLSIGYDGQIGGTGTQSAGRVTLSVGF